MSKIQIELQGILNVEHVPRADNHLDTLILKAEAKLRSHHAAVKADCDVTLGLSSLSQFTGHRRTTHACDIVGDNNDEITARPRA